MSGERPPGPVLPELSSAARRELEEIYRRVDDRIAATGVECRLRGRCCDFEAQDHRLYASGVEVAYVREARPEPFEPGSVLCPFWKDGLCTERERRPLGCRTYFCDERYREDVHAIYESAHREIVALGARHGIPYTYGSFVDALRSAPDGVPRLWQSQSRAGARHATDTDGVPRLWQSQSRAGARHATDTDGVPRLWQSQSRAGPEHGLASGKAVAHEDPAEPPDGGGAAPDGGHGRALRRE